MFPEGKTHPYLREGSLFSAHLWANAVCLPPTLFLVGFPIEDVLPLTYYVYWGWGVGGLSLLFNLKSQICRLEQSAPGLDTEECTSLGDLVLSWVQRLDGASGFRLSLMDCLCEEYENLWQRLNNCLPKPFSPGHYTTVT